MAAIVSRHSPVFRLPLRFGKVCPGCSHHTQRIPFPVLLVPLRAMGMGHVTYRECRACRWKGVAVHREKSRRGARPRW
jgi:hypothetical protein